MLHTLAIVAVVLTATQADGDDSTGRRLLASTSSNPSTPRSVASASSTCSVAVQPTDSHGEGCRVHTLELGAEMQTLRHKIPEAVVKCQDGDFQYAYLKDDCTRELGNTDAIADGDIQKGFYCHQTNEQENAFQAAREAYTFCRGKKYNPTMFWWEGLTSNYPTLGFVCGSLKMQSFIDFNGIPELHCGLKEITKEFDDHLARLATEVNNNEVSAHDFMDKFWTKAKAICQVYRTTDTDGSHNRCVPHNQRPGLCITSKGSTGFEFDSLEASVAAPKKHLFKKAFNEANNKKIKVWNNNGKLLMKTEDCHSADGFKNICQHLFVGESEKEKRCTYIDSVCNSADRNNRFYYNPSQ